MRRAVSKAQNAAFNPSTEAEKHAALIGKRDAALIAASFVGRIIPTAFNFDPHEPNPAYRLM